MVQLSFTGRCFQKFRIAKFKWYVCFSLCVLCVAKYFHARCACFVAPGIHNKQSKPNIRWKHLPVTLNGYLLSWKHFSHIALRRKHFWFLSCGVKLFEGVQNYLTCILPTLSVLGMHPKVKGRNSNPFGMAAWSSI